MNQSLLDSLKEKPLLGDGAMGTQLMAAGLEQGGCGEQWNVTQPEKVLEIQRRYAEAGSDCILTNTFGGCQITLARHGQEKHAAPINRAAAEIVRASSEPGPIAIRFE